MVSRQVLQQWVLAVVVLSLTAVMYSQTAPGDSANMAVPRLVSYSGKAADSHGKAIAGRAGVTFAIYKDQYEGAPLWLETQSITADAKGNFSAQLGATKPEGLPLELFTSVEARWLGVRVNGAEEQPRVLLLSVPYALKAADSQTLGGLPPSAFVLAAPATASKDNQEAAASTNDAASSRSLAPAVTSNVTTTGGTVNAIPLFTTATNIQNSILTQAGTTILNIRGKLNLPAIAQATATLGRNSEPQSLTASSFSSATNKAVSQTFLWQAEPANNNTPTASGTLNLLFGSGATAPFESGLKINSKGQITFAAGQTFPAAGTVKSVGLSAPSSDFTLSGSPVTGTGTLSLNWKVAPTNVNTANAIVKRNPAGGFSAGAIAATQLTTSGKISAAQLATSGSITAAAMGLGTQTPTERLDLGNDGNVVISTFPPDDATADIVGYNLIGRGPGGVPNKWSIYTAAVGGGFGVPANAFSVYQYPPNGDPGCCLQRFTILPPYSGQSVSTVVIDGQGHLNIGNAGTVNALFSPSLAVADSATGAPAAEFLGFVSLDGDVFLEGCISNQYGVLLGNCLSDARLKQNIQPFPPVLDKLIQLQPVSYRWKSNEFPRLHLGTSDSSGLNAEDVEKLFPEMVSRDKDGFKRVNMGELPYLLLQAVRELEAENAALRNELKTTEERLATRLENREKDREGKAGEYQRSELTQLRTEVARLAAMIGAKPGTAGASGESTPGR